MWSYQTLNQPYFFREFDIWCGSSVALEVWLGMWLRLQVWLKCGCMVVVESGCGYGSSSSSGLA